MKVVSRPRFIYPNLGHGHAWYGVDVYRLGLTVLVVLRDQDDHEGSSLTNALEGMARKVRRELLEEAGLAGLKTHWITWSRTDGIASVVSFTDEEALAGPRWSYLPPAEFAKVLAAFEAEDQLEAWIREGALEVEEWIESTGEERKRPD